MWRRRVGVGADRLDDLGDLVDVATVGRRPRPPLVAVDRPEVAVVVGPLVPDRDAALLQPAHVGVAAQEPQQLADDRAQVQPLGRDHREALGEVEAHLVAEHAAGARAGAVGLVDTGRHDVVEQVEVLAHARQPTRARPRLDGRSRRGALPRSALPLCGMTSSPVRPCPHRDGDPDVVRRRRVDLTTAHRRAGRPTSCRPGHDGIVVNGTTGESATLSDDESLEMVAPSSRRVGDRAAVVAGVGSNDTAPQRRDGRPRRGRRRRRAPARRRPTTTSRPRPASSRTAGPSPTPPTCRSCSTTSPAAPASRSSTDTLVTGSPSTRASSRSRTPRATTWASTKVMAATDLLWFSGDDAVNLPLLALGATGVVSVVGHVAGEQYAAMVAAVDRGDLAAAREHPPLAGPGRRRHHEHLAGGDHGQGRARRARASSTTRPCGCRSSSHRRSTSTLLRAGLASLACCEPSPPRAEPAPARSPTAACASSPLGGLGEVGRNMAVIEHARPAARHRLRRALPRRPPPRRRPDPARLRVPRGPARRRAGDGPHPRPRGPHRRRALPAARSSPTSRSSARR